jgi:hypothetical protein
VTATSGQASLKQAEMWRARRFIDGTIKHVRPNIPERLNKALRSRTVADYKVAKSCDIVQNVMAAVVKRF